MTFYYSDPSREDDDHALPNVETFVGDDGHWYCWACFPGCMPDGEPFGPYDTEAEALSAAREWCDE